ncbi:hypothetical protein FHS27_002103 [Rhodopirellula rubra]|uniref:Uncharacterized protein n=1 Tax=Aporhodopirellula rubra TaxID=980271 RepID=A0A7W5DXD2_9BACT|nr:hypothetical protein [Aporhodopirellula rubra]MBB3206294.1 hypothetical protein [Aporhodopirellula rubra]
MTKISDAGNVSCISMLSESMSTDSRLYVGITTETGIEGFVIQFSTS